MSADRTVAERLQLLADVTHEVASALASMGSEEQWNLGTPQTVRDLCRHQAGRLRAALKEVEIDE